MPVLKVENNTDAAEVVFILFTSTHACTKKNVIHERNLLRVLKYSGSTKSFISSLVTQM